MKSFYAHLRLIPFVLLLTLSSFGGSFFTHHAAADSGCSVSAAGSSANVSVATNPVTIDPVNGGTVQYTITPGNSSFDYTSCPPVPFNVWALDGGQDGPDGQSPTTLVNNFGSYSLTIPASLSGDSTIEIYVQDTTNVISGMTTVNVQAPASGGSGTTNQNTVNFGTTAVGQTSSQDVNFNNTGTGSWTVTDVQITNNPGNLFSIDTEDCDTNGNTITASNNCTINVNFDPQTTASATANLVVSYDDQNGNAQTQTYTLLGNSGSGGSGGGGSGGTSSGGGSSITCGTDSSICNPIQGDPTNDLQGLLVLLITYLLGMIGIVAVLMIIWGAYQLVISNGNEEAVKKGRQTITYAIAGLVLAVLSYSIISIIENAIRNQK